MPGFGVGEFIVLVCLCGFLGMGIVVLIGLAGILVMGQRTHGELADLDGDDHPHYLTVGRGDPRYARQEHNHSIEDLVDFNTAGAIEGEELVGSQDSGDRLSMPASGDAVYARNMVKIARVAPREFDCWFTLDAPGNQAEVLDLPPSALQAFRETQAGPKFLSKITVETVEQVRRNQFTIRLRQESEFLRIKFDLINISVSGDRTLKSFALENELRYIGQSADHTVTLHLRIDPTG